MPTILNTILEMFFDQKSLPRWPTFMLSFEVPDANLTVRSDPNM